MNDLALVITAVTGLVSAIGAIVAALLSARNGRRFAAIAPKIEEAVQVLPKIVEVLPVVAELHKAVKNGNGHG